MADGAFHHATAHLRTWPRGARSTIYKQYNEAKMGGGKKKKNQFHPSQRLPLSRSQEETNKTKPFRAQAFRLAKLRGGFDSNAS